MNSMNARRTAIAVTAAVLMPFSLAACSDAGSDTKAAPPPPARTSPATAPRRTTR